MTKKTIIKILTLVLIAIPVVSALTPHIAHAGWLDDSFYTFFAFITQGMLALAGYFLSLAGVLLNGVMVATLNMKLIVDNTPAIGVAWRTIRDFSSIFIIFMLLYASINMILGRRDHNLGTLIKNVIIAGLLINFSLLGTKLLIDASNIVSTSFYCAMVPADPTANANFCNGSVTNPTSLGGSFTSSGIANVFMQSLNIQAVVSNGKTLVAGTDPHLSIALSNVGASILMIVAGLSFITAAIMFAIRIGVLILLMAFSPIYIIAIMLPGTEVEKQAKKWSGALYSMCLFMPVYLFLMYIAVSIINDPHFFDFARIADKATNTGLLSAHTVGIFLQYMIAFIFINAPLVAAISVASEGVDVVGKVGKSIQKWGQGAIQGGASRAWRETGGRAANAMTQNQTLRNIAGKSIFGELALKGTRGVAGNYSDALKKKTEERVKFAESLGHDEAKMSVEQTGLRNLKTALAGQKATLDAMKRAAGPTPSAVALVNIANQEAIIAGTKTNIGGSEARALGIETARQTAYKTRTENGLWNKRIAPSNKVASAKVEISVVEKIMKQAKDDLKDAKDDLKTLEKAIKNNSTGGTPAQIAEQARLITEIATKTSVVNGHENRIDQLKLVK